MNQQLKNVMKNRTGKLTLQEKKAFLLTMANGLEKMFEEHKHDEGWVDFVYNKDGTITLKSDWIKQIKESAENLTEKDNYLDSVFL